MANPDEKSSHQNWSFNKINLSNKNDIETKKATQIG